MNKVIQGDCLEVMKDISDKSIDMILCDLPYGVTTCKWDIIISFENLWEQYKRIIKDNGAIVLTACEPFASLLRVSNLKMYKYDWVYKKRGVGYLLSKKRPLQGYENILVFYKKQPVYNPQKVKRTSQELSSVISTNKFLEKGYKINTERKINIRSVKIKDSFTKYPTTFIDFIKSQQVRQYVHPTQKPVALFEYLIKTYTNENDLVLDNCAGSGTTGIACLNLNRKYILIEKEERYCKIIKERVKAVNNKLL